MVFSGCISCEIHWEEAVEGTVPTARPHSALFALRTRGAEFTATPGTTKSQTLLSDRAHGTWYWSEEPSAHHMLLRIPGIKHSEVESKISKNWRACVMTLRFKSLNRGLPWWSSG